MNRRNERRCGTQDKVHITIDGNGHRCSMRNLSPSGCQLECREIVAERGARVELALLPGLVVHGEVAWQLGESIGIVFPEPLSTGVVRHYALDDWLLRGDWSMAKWHAPED